MLLCEKMLSNECFLMRHGNAIAASAINGSPRADLQFAIHEQYRTASVAQDKARPLGRQRSSSNKGVTTPVLHHKVMRTERTSVICASGLEEEGPSLNRQEAVDFLSVAVHALLRPEIQKRLRELLEKNKQPIHGEQSRVLEQASQENHLSSPAPSYSLEDLEEVGYVKVEGDATNSGRSPSDQESLMTSTGNISSASQTTELVECEGQSQSIETMESCAQGVDGKGDSSLTSIRRLKFLDVHSYVHNALRESALRSWLNSRTIEE